MSMIPFNLDGTDGVDMTPMGMQQCPRCKGEKKIDVEVREIRGQELCVEHIKLPCVSCDGQGEVTPARLKQLKAMDDAWCRCEVPGDPIYYQHGHSHGYDCSKCGGLLQTG